MGVGSKSFLVLGGFDLEEQAGQGSPWMKGDGDEPWVEGERRRWRGRVVLDSGMDLREGQWALAVLSGVVV
jgi:hypothetical protein